MVRKVNLDEHTKRKIKLIRAYVQNGNKVSIASREVGVPYYTARLEIRAFWEEGCTSLKEYQVKLALEKPENMAFYQLMHEALERLNKSQAWLAREVDESPQLISAYYRGLSFPSKDKKERLLQALNLSNQDLEAKIKELEKNSKL